MIDIHEVIRMKEKHLIALDLDGTLLSDQRQILAPTKETIQHLIEAGHVVVIATGRSNKLSIHYYHELGLKTPLINSNGAVIHHPHDKNWGVHHTPLERKLALDIIDANKQLQGKNVLAAVQDTVYLDQYDEHIFDFYQPKKDDPFHVGPVTDLLKDDPTLMLLYPDKDNLQRLTSYLNDLHADIIDHRNWGEPTNIIEVMNNKVNKATAIQQVAKEFGISKERIIAFGDETNDLAMIDYAGVGVAMGNAVDELKTVAKHVTDTNENNGIGQFLADYFQLKITSLQK